MFSTYMYTCVLNQGIGIETLHFIIPAFNDMQARINVPAPSVRTLQRKIAASNFTEDASIQVNSLHFSDDCRTYVYLHLY